MKKNSNETKKANDEEIPVNEKDPTIRQEFPGAEKSQKKIEAGIRNVKSKLPGGPDESPLPPSTKDEPVDEQSDNLNK